jgi:hypothetical protein
MTVLPWVLAAILAMTVVWLLLALSGATRTIASLRAGDDADGDAEVHHLSSGLPAGTRAPAIEGLDDDLDDSRHLVTFVDPDCAACDGLVPALISAAGARQVPQTVMVSRGRPAEHPAAWVDTGPRARLLIESESAVTDAYRVDVTPTSFLVDEGGIIVAGGPTATIEDVLTLVADVEGVRIAPGTEREPEVIRGTP